MSDQKIVIIGAGLAGYTVAKELRKHTPNAQLTLITQDDGAFYSKPMLSNSFGSKKPPDKLATQSCQQMAATLDATIIANTQVTVIHRQDRTVVTPDQTIPYDQLVLAVGAHAIRPPFGGDAVAEVCSVNNLSDYRSFREKLAGKKKLVIIGAGLIGCEFANDLRIADYDVTVIAPGKAPLDHLLPPEAAMDLLRGLEAIGVHWALGSVVKTVDYAEAHKRIGLENGQHIDADVVLSAIGLRPETTLADDSGLNTNRGIVVDRYLRTNDERIYAIGDCAEVEGLVLPFVLPIMNAARALGRTLAGEDTRVTYPAMPIVVKTPACPLVVSPPARGAEGDWKIASDELGTKALFHNAKGDLLGFALTKDYVKERQILAKELSMVLA